MVEPAVWVYLDEDALGMRGGLVVCGYGVYDARSENLLGTPFDGLHVLRAVQLRAILITNNRRDFEALVAVWHANRRDTGA